MSAPPGAGCLLIMPHQSWTPKEQRYPLERWRRETPSLEFYKAGIESKDQSRKKQAKAGPSLVASTNSEQDNSDLVGKLDLEGHFTYGSSPLNADLLSELSKNRGFKLAALNITSIPGHIEELRIYMNSKCIDILAVNETRLDDTISSGEVTVPGYALERNDRNRDGGGVALYIRNTINYERLFDFEWKASSGLALR